MRTREWYEDSIHSIISRCLPSLPKSDIRPAYLKTRNNNPFAVNHMDRDDPMKDGVDGVTPMVDIIYFWLHFDPLDFLATEVVSGTVSTVVPFKITISCYGEGSLSNVIKLRSFLRTPEILNETLKMKAVFSTEPRVTTFTEEINGEWYERNDLDISLLTQIDDFSEGGATPSILLSDDGAGYSKSTGGKVGVGGKDGN